MSKPSSGSSATAKPSATATPKPTVKPTAAPTAKPTSKPSATATPKPAATAKPTTAPTAKPTAVPTSKPTAAPTATPEPQKVWVVDVPAKEEVGHWEEDGYWWSDVVYRCNECKETFSTTDAFYEHVIPLVEAGKHSMGSYTEVPGESYWVKTGQHWVVDEPAQEEQGHWEYK